MADKSKKSSTKTVTETSVEKLVKTAPKWWDEYRDNKDGKVSKEIDHMDIFWSTYYGFIQSFTKRELHELMRSVRDSIEGRDEAEVKREYKAYVKRGIMDTLLYQSNDKENCVILTKHMEANKTVQTFINNKKDFDSKIEDKNAEYEAILNEEEGIKVESTKPRKDGPVTKAVKEVLEDIETQDSSILILKEQKEIEATVAYVNARHSDDPVTQEAVQEFEQETIAEVKGATDLLKQGSVDRSNLTKAGKTRKRGTGVIAQITKILAEEGYITKTEILIRLEEQFPERNPDSMLTTINCSLHGYLERKGLSVSKTEVGTETVNNRDQIVWGYKVEDK